MAPTPKRSSRGSLVVSLGLVMLAVALVLIGGLTLLYFSDFTLPGVQALGVDLGGKSALQAADALQGEWQSQVIVVATGSRSWSVPPNRLGLLLDADATVRAAQTEGRSGASLGSFWRSGRWATIDPVWTFDPVVAEAFLRMLAAEVQVPGQDAGLRIVDGRPVETAAVPSQVLDVRATQNYLAGHTQSTLSSRHLALLMTQLPPAVPELDAAGAQAERLLAAPPTILLYDAIKDEKLAWQITPQQLGSWMTLQLNPEDRQWLGWKVDEKQVAVFLKERQAATLDDGRYVDVEKALPSLMKAILAPGISKSAGEGDAVSANAALTDTVPPDPAVEASGEAAPIATPGPIRPIEVRLAVLHGTREHVVTSGETIATIATKYGMPYPYIQQANPDAGDMLRVGQKLTIPAPDVFIPLPPVENKRIIVSIAKQNVTVYENGKVKWKWAASTGMASSPTSPGVFQVQSHDGLAYAANWDLHMPFFMGIYKPVPGNDFMNGFHGFPSRKGSQILWTRNLGGPITYGCVLVSTDNAKRLYEWADNGVVVEIRP